MMAKRFTYCGKAYRSETERDVAIRSQLVHLLSMTKMVYDRDRDVVINIAADHKAAIELERCARDCDGMKRVVDGCSVIFPRII